MSEIGRQVSENAPCDYTIEGHGCRKMARNARTVVISRTRGTEKKVASGSSDDWHSTAIQIESSY
jgi:hypothetical protein